MAHWRTFMDRDYLGAWDFPQDRTGTIVAVDEGRLPGTGEIKANRKPIITLKGTEKKLIAGATICKVIGSLYGNDMANWPGKRITLYATTCKGKKKGEVVDCVRVRPIVPTGPGAPIPSQPVDEAMRERQMRAAGEEPTPREGEVAPSDNADEGP